MADVSVCLQAGEQDDSCVVGEPDWVDESL